MLQGIRYCISDESVSDAVMGHIRKRYDVGESESYTLTRTFLDSFDWRLYAGGVRLWVEERDGVRSIYQSGIPKSSPARKFAITDSIPMSADDLHDGPVRQAISRLLEVRAVLPQLEVKSRIRCLHILDGAHKTVLRFNVEQTACRVPGRGDYIDLGCHLVLQPVKGYPEAMARMEALINRKFKLPVDEKELFTEALSAIDVEPCGYSSRIGFQFDPATPSIQAVKEIQLHLLDIIEANVPGVKADIDSEFLHDLRVAVRRARSALTQIKGVFSPEDIDRFKSRLAWVGRVTGPPRDMDVYLLEFDRYRACLPEQFRDDLDPLHDFLQSHREIEHRQMVKSINSPHFRTLIKDLRSFLETVTEQDGADEAATPISELANRRIYKMYRRVLRHGQAIADDSPAECLHELRKECKKLRYLMEFFRSLYPKKEIGQAIKSVKQLLDNLGSFQDLEVQAYTLRDYARQMVEEGDTPHDTLLAMGMLVDGLLSRQRQAREEFSSHFASFSNQKNRKAFKALFSPTTNKGRV